MLMPSSASVRNIVLAMPACERMPDADDRHFRDLVVADDFRAT